MNILTKVVSGIQSLTLLIALFLITIPTLTSFAQAEADIDRNISSPKMKARAKHALQTGDVYTALFYYEEVIKRDSSDIDDRFQLAELYRLSRNYVKAEKEYSYVADKDNSEYPLALYFKAQMQKMQGKYLDAKKNYNEFKKESGGIGDKNFKFILAKEIAGCDSGIVFKDFPENTTIENAGAQINQPHTEFSPFLLNDSTLLFGTLRMETLQYFNNKEEYKEKKPVRQIHKAERNGTTWEDKGPFEVINDPHMDMGNFAYSPYSERFYFTKCSANNKGHVTCKLYVTEKVKDKWSTPALLPDPINLDGFTSTQPTIVVDTLIPVTPVKTTSDSAKATNKHQPKPKAKAIKGQGIPANNRTEYLYFVSDRPGGKGGLDIWYTSYNSAKKVWQKPANFGWVNTSETECTPFFHIPTQTFYFSSNGQATAGGLDIFKMQEEGARFSKPKNLSFPINSPQDELGYNLSSNGKTGFFVSNRPGGTPYFHETCCDDIFAFEVLPPKPFNCTLDLAVIAPDSVPCAGKLLQIQAYDLKTNEKKSDTIRLTDCKVRYPLDKNHRYEFSIDLPGFEKDTLVVATRDMASADVIDKDLVLKPKTKINDKIYAIVNENPTEGSPFVLKDIQYESNQTTLNEDAIAVLDSILIPFLKAHPKDKILITSHTDDRGSHKYNMTLSQKRAENVLKHLIAKGIEPQRLQAKGMGETKPIAPNRTPDGNDNLIGQSINRRTEFLLIKPQQGKKQ